MDSSNRRSLPPPAKKTKSILDYFKPKGSQLSTSTASASKTVPQIDKHAIHSKIRLSDKCIPTLFSQVSHSPAKKLKTRRSAPAKPLVPRVSNDIIFLSDSDDDTECPQNHVGTTLNQAIEISDVTEISSQRSVIKESVTQEHLESGNSQSSTSEDQENHEPEVEKLKESCPIDLSEFLEILLSDTDEASVTIPEEETERKDYKFTNFRGIIDFVLNDLEHNSHLFNDSDWKVIESFTSLSVPAQRLYVRLFLRKHKWIRANRIVYDDIADDLEPVMKELNAAGLIEHCDTIDNLAEALDLLDLNEVKLCARSIKASSTSSNNAFSSLNQGFVNKQSLIQSIMKHSKSNQSIKSHFTGKNFTVEEVVLNHVKKILGNTGYRIAKEASGLFSRMTYLYFPPQVNEDENGVAVSHEFYHGLLVATGDMTYPDYSIAKETIVYQSRQDLIDYSDACHLETKTLTAVEKKSHAVVLNELLPEALYGFEKHLEKTCNLPAFLRNQTAGHVYTRCLSHSVTSLEQSKNYEKAVTILQKLLDQKIFCHNARGKWYERLVIDLGHLKKNEKVAEVLKDAMSDFLVKLYLRYTLFCKAKKILKNSQVLKDASTEFANVEKSKHVTIECTILPKSVQGKRTMFTDPSGTTILPVEEVALRHYKTEGGFSHGLHSESVIYHSLMNILLWDVIYTPMPDAFRFFHQNLPLDFVHEDFYLRRQESIDARLDELKNMSDGQVNSEIDRIWMRYNNTSCLVSWDLVSAQTLKELASCIGIHVLVPIMKRMICNFRLNRSGFPDLILWDPSTFRVKAVEVKGPTDSLSAKQILWLDFFNSCGLPCEVCYVKAKSKP